KGCQVIFLTSDGFGSNVEDVIKAYPQIVFYTISPEAEESNATTYYGRLYQARYLAGMAAGMMTRNNVLGFVAAMDNAQVARDVNAFMLGARSVNPDVKLVVRFTGSWFNTAAEHKAAMKLIEKDHADLLAYHTSTSETVGVADEKGVYSIGYNMMEKSYSQLYLGAVVFHWEILYRSILQDFARGSVRGTGYYWWGVSEGAVSWEKESDLLGDDIIQRIEEERKGFDEGNDVFMGEIRRNDGRVMCRKKERMSDDALLRNMNWFVEGVEIEED
ncbi:MAG: BMP family ABC transporter substrate-binding protein, partial [Lachnospiraceae bacterium]|nr:BMP family ABC transporter substrate-binding protein [Lachnospiraceae bacterium]